MHGDFWDRSVEQLIFWGAMLAILMAIGIYVLKRIRAESIQNEPIASELMTNLREIHARGGLSEAEFRNIKTKLAARLEEELRDNAGKG